VAKGLVDEFGDSLSKGNVTQAGAALHKLRAEIQLHPQSKASIGSSLAARCADLPVLVRQNTPAKSKEVLDFLRELGGFQIEELAHDLVLARALVAARSRNYKGLGDELNQAEGIALKKPKALEDLLDEVIQLCMDDKTATPQNIKVVLDAVSPGVLSAAQSPRLPKSYGELVAKFVALRLPGLDQAGEYQELIPYCRQAKETMCATPLTLACLAESVLLQRDGQLPKNPDSANVAEARQALGLVTDTGGSDELYVRFVRGLVYQAEQKWVESVREYGAAFKASPLPKTLANNKRRSFAARANYEAGKKLANLPSEAFPFLKAANKLQPTPLREYQLQMLEAAAKLPSAGEFQDALQALAEGQALATWKGTDAVQLANLFVTWANKQNKAQALLFIDDVAPILEAALQLSPADEHLNFWSGVSYWRKRQTPESRQKAFERFGRVLAKSTRERDGFETKVYEAIGMNATDRLDLLTAVLPQDRKHLQEKHTELLLKRARLIATNVNLLRADFASGSPVFLADADDILRLQKHPMYKMQAQAAVWLACYNGFEKGLVPQGQTVEYQQVQRKRHAEIGTLLLLDETYQWPPALDWAKNYSEGSDPELANKIKKMIENHTPKPPQEGLRQRFESLRPHYA
jgi:hypothetical protein